MKKTVLVVDDDPKNIKLIKDVLEAFGFRIISAPDGEQAVEWATEEKPDLILMDLNLPVLDGRRAIEIIKQKPETKHIPVIVLTGWGTENFDQLEKIGCVGVIPKPFDIMELKSRVEEHTNR
jgi:two-component system cell cycle response regulator DivK